MLALRMRLVTFTIAAAALSCAHAPVASAADTHSVSHTRTEPICLQTHLSSQQAAGYGTPAPYIDNYPLPTNIHPCEHHESD